MLALLALFSGYNGRVKIRDRVIIQGMAIDMENEQYRMTVQTYKPSSLQEPKNEYELHFAKGESLYEALRAINTITGQQAFFSNLQVILLSREVIDSGLSPVLDFFARYSEIRKSVTVAAAFGTASDLLTIDSESGLLPAERINRIMTFGTDSTSYDGSKLMDITERYLSDSSDAFLPLLDLSESDNRREVKICGVLCFSGKNASGILSPEQSIGFNWISGFNNRQSLTVENQSGIYTLSVQKVSCKISAKEEDGLPVINVALKFRFNVNEIDAKIDPVTEADIAEVSLPASEEAARLARQSVDRGFYGLSSDIFEFGRYVKRDCPQLYGDNGFKDIDKSRWIINVSTSAEIYRVGKTNRAV